METLAKNLSVFLVDDDRMFLLSLKKEIKNRFKNVRLFTFLTGEDCLKRMNEKPDIIILDYYLANGTAEGMNGIDVLKEIKSISTDNEVIFLSAENKEDVVMNAIKNGASEYLPKTENVFSRLRKIMRKTIYKIEHFRFNRLYEKGNYVVAGLILLIVLAMTIYYLKH
jgi:two-component system OmpR family response regulator